MRLRTLGMALSAVFAAGACAAAQPQARRPAGEILRLELQPAVDAFGGATPPGAAGPYTVLSGVVHGALDPSAPENAGIVDLDKAPRDARGYVEYSTDVVILRPRDARSARRVLFYDVNNRGNKLGQGTFIGGGGLANGAPPAEGFPSLLSRGYTVVWSGWQGNIAQSGNGVEGPLGTRFPVARGHGGKPLEGYSREEFIPDYAGGAPTTIPLTYPPASPSDHGSASLTARQSWLDAQGREDYAAPSVPVPAWHYLQQPDGSYAVAFAPPAAVPGPGGTVPADAGTIYSFVYRARDPIVMGIGFAAVRDLVAFLRRGEADASGQPNPLNDMKAAACAGAAGHCAGHRRENFDLAIGEGISQSGRFLRDFLYQGFNRGADGRKVFDGLLPIVPAARRTWINERFAQPGRWSKQHEDHWMPGDQFPFAYNVIADPVSGRVDGLLRRCAESATCPQIMQLDGSFEWWGGRGSLVVTDGAGRDLPLPPNVRYYLVPGTQHTGGAGVGSGVASVPAAGSLCRYPGSPVAEAPFDRALVPALENWIADGKLPPPSRYPTVASGEAVLPTRAATGFPDLSAIVVPSGQAATPTPLQVSFSGLTNQLFATDYAQAMPRAHLSARYAVLVPRADANGNELGGIATPELSVPLATYAGWNLRGAGHAEGEICTSNGSAIPFAVSPATRAAGDPRPSLAELYRNRADYAAKVGAAAAVLVRQGYLLPADARQVFEAQAAQVSPALIP